MTSKFELPEVPTPGWRTIDESQLLALSNLHVSSLAVADLSEEDEDYIRKHEQLAREERARWGYSMKKISGSAKGANSKSTSKKSRASQSKSLEAVYPTPMESFLLVEEAKKRYLGNTALVNNEKGTRQDQLRRNLAHFVLPIDPFSAIEALIKEEKSKLKACLVERKAQMEDCSRRRGGGTSNSAGVSVNGLSSGDIVENPPKRPKTNEFCQNFLHQSGRKMPDALRKTKEPEKTSLDVALMELSLARLESIESTVAEKSASLYSACEDLLKQAEWDLPSPKSFVSLKQQFLNASNSGSVCAPNGTHRSESRLSEIIKSEIDSSIYPVVANAFWLSDNYRLDGCDVDKDWAAKMCRKRSNSIIQRSENEDEVDDQTVTSHGFSLPLHALDSDDEEDVEVGNPLTDETWAEVRRRIWRKRKRSKKKDNEDEFLDLVDVPDVEINISVHSTPNSIRNAENIDPVHPDDTFHLTQTKMGSHPPPPPSSSPPSPHLPNGCGVTHEVDFEDDDLSELDLPPPTPIDTPEMSTMMAPNDSILGLDSNGNSVSATLPQSEPEPEPEPVPVDSNLPDSDVNHRPTEISDSPVRDDDGDYTFSGKPNGVEEHLEPSNVDALRSTANGPSYYEDVP